MSELQKSNEIAPKVDEIADADAAWGGVTAELRWEFVWPGQPKAFCSGADPFAIGQMQDGSPSRGVARTWKQILEKLLKHFENEPASIN